MSQSSFQINAFSFLFAFLFLSTSLSAQTVTRGPYLQMLGQNTVTIRWRTDSPSSSIVWYGYQEKSLHQNVYNNELTTEHEVVLSNLAANTRYHYAIGYNSQQLAGRDKNHYFKTSPEGPIDETINIWVLGDAGKTIVDQRKTRDAFYELHGDAPVGMALLLGDNAYWSGRDDDYQNSWFEDMYEERLVNMPLFSTYGNHDGLASNSEDESGPYFDIFNFPKNGELGGVASGRERYYSFDYGDIHVISLNNHDEDLSIDGEQYNWLAADLAANDKGWTIMICHFQLHGGLNNRADDSWRAIAMKESYMPLLEEHGVDLVLTGHAHHYQRSYLLSDFFGNSNEFVESEHALDIGDGQIDGDGAYQKGADNKGVVYMISGSAGSVYGLGTDLYHPAMYANDLVLGTVRLQIKYDELNAIFLTDEGIILDHFTIQKELPPITPINASESPTEDKLIIYPNPSKDILHLVFEASDADDEVDIQIVDAKGALSFLEKCQIKKGDARISLDISRLPSGVYFLKMKKRDKVLNGQVVIVK